MNCSITGSESSRFRSFFVIFTFPCFSFISDGHWNRHFSFFVVQDKTVLIPLQHFDLIMAPIAGNEQCSVLGIQLKGSLQNSCQPAYGFSYIRDPGARICRWCFWLRRNYGNLKRSRVPDKLAYGSARITSVCCRRLRCPFWIKFLSEFAKKALIRRATGGKAAFLRSLRELRRGGGHPALVISDMDKVWSDFLAPSLIFWCIVEVLRNALFFRILVLWSEKTHQRKEVRSVGIFGAYEKFWTDTGLYAGILCLRISQPRGNRKKERQILW